MSSKLSRFVLSKILRGVKETIASFIKVRALRKLKKIPIELTINDIQPTRSTEYRPKKHRVSRSNEVTMVRRSVLRFLLVFLLSVSVLTHAYAYTWTEDTSVGTYKHWNQITSSSDGTKLAATCFDDDDNFPDVSGSIYTSNDSGATWTEVTSTGIKKPWYGITSSSDGVKLALLSGLETFGPPRTLEPLGLRIPLLVARNTGTASRPRATELNWLLLALKVLEAFGAPRTQVSSGPMSPLWGA